MMVETLGFEWMRAPLQETRHMVTSEHSGYVSIETNVGVLVLCRHEKVTYDNGDGTIRTVTVKPEELNRAPIAL